MHIDYAMSVRPSASTNTRIIQSTFMKYNAGSFTKICRQTTIIFKMKRQQYGTMRLFVCRHYHKASKSDFPSQQNTLRGSTRNRGINK